MKRERERVVRVGDDEVCERFVYNPVTGSRYRRGWCF